MKSRKIDEVIKKIQPVDYKIVKETLKKFDNLTKPRHSLGYLETIVAQASGVYGISDPHIKRKVIFLMAADHGVTAERVSAYPSEITRQMVINFLKGGAAINVLANHHGIEVIISDMGVRGNLIGHENLIINKISSGTNNMAEGPAMSTDMAEESILAGYKIFEDAYAEKQINLIGLGEMGIGNTTASSAIIALLTGSKIEEVVDMGTGLDGEGVRHKISIIKRALKINMPDLNNPVDILAKVGGFEIGGLVGCILAAASRRVPVVMDGLISGACALIATKIAPFIQDYLFSSHASRERGHRVALDYLGKKPVFDLGMHLGEGTGAVFGINFIEAGFKLLNQMATFNDLAD